jgi:hypothetical protein
MRSREFELWDRRFADSIWFKFSESDSLTADERAD